MLDSITKFVATAKSRHTVRTHVLALLRLSDRLGPDRSLDDVAGDELAAALTDLWGQAAPATWNRRRASVIAWLTWSSRQTGAAAPVLPASCARKPTPEQPATEKYTDDDQVG